MTGRDDGKETGDDSGVVPDAPLSRSLANHDTIWQSVTLKNLDPNLNYKIEVVSSYSDAWSWTIDFEVAGLTDSLLADNNTTESCVFDNISPDANNEIVVSFKGPQWAFLNAMVVTEI
jgi:hypothetical protein